MDKNYVLITGGAKGIGAAIARRACADGYSPIILDLVEPDRGIAAEFARIDLRDAPATSEILDALTKRFVITRLVNNAGIVHPARLEQTTPEAFEEVMMLNARAAMLCVKSLAPGMRRKKFGRIVSITSRALLGKEMRTAYAASKGAVASMSRTWALELASDSITVNTVAPGPVGTEAFHRNNPPGDPRTDALKKSIPLKRLGSTDDVAHAVGFFLDERSGFITGQTLYVCGGLTVGISQS